MRTVLVNDLGECCVLRRVAFVDVMEVESSQGFRAVHSDVAAVLDNILGDVVGTGEVKTGLACGEAMAGLDRFHHVVGLVLFFVAVQRGVSDCTRDGGRKNVNAAI